MADQAGGNARAASRSRLSGAILAVLALGPAPARAQEDSRAAPPAPSCEVPPDQLAAPAPLPHVAQALKVSRKLDILTIGSPAGIGRGRKSFPAALESLLEQAMSGADVVIVNRPMSGEIVETAVERIRTEVALSRPDLIVWQVGANDALAHVPPDQFEAALLDGVRWARDAGVDVLLVGFEANPWLHDENEVLAIREATNRVARAENVLYLRRFDAMRFVERTRRNVAKGDEPFSAASGYECMAEQIAQALAANLVLRRIRPPAAATP